MELLPLPTELADGLRLEDVSFKSSWTNPQFPKIRPKITVPPF